MPTPATVSNSTRAPVARAFVPLSPRHQRFFDMAYELPHYFNTPARINVGPDFNFDAMKAAFQHLVMHHDSLRLRFVCEAGQWLAFLDGGRLHDVFEVLDMRGMTRDEQLSAMKKEGSRLHGSLDLANGPLMKVVHVQLGDAIPGRLLVITHHMLVDGLSMTILLEDLRTLYAQAIGGQPFALPPVSMPFSEWVSTMRRHAQSTALRAELAYWARLADSQPLPMPIDHEHGKNDEASLMSTKAHLSVEETLALMRGALKQHGAGIADALLAALATAYHGWTGRKQLCVEMTHHGRDFMPDEMDATRTVGLLTANFPVILDMGETHTPTDTLRNIRQTLAAVPNKGIGYSLLRYLNEDEAVATLMRQLPQAEMHFNYIGHGPAANPVGVPKEDFGPHRYAGHGRACLVSCKAMIQDGALTVVWESSANLYKSETIEKLATTYMAFLRQILPGAAHCHEGAHR